MNKAVKTPDIAEPLHELTPALLKDIGKAWGGRHWQSDLARETGKSKSMITRYINEDREGDGRTPTVDFGLALDRTLVDKIEDVVEFIGHDGSPHKPNPLMTKAKKLIEQGIAMLRELSPQITRVSIEETSKRTQKAGRKPKKRAKKAG